MAQVGLALAAEPAFTWRSPAAIAHRVPWLWHDLVVSRSRLPLWMLSALVFLAMYGFGVFLALLSGDLHRFLADPRFFLPAISASLSSFIVSYVRRAIGDLWTKWTPWLANPEDQLVAFEAAIPRLLMRGFWVVALLILALYSQYFFLEDPWVRGFAGPDIFRFVYVVWAAAIAYFFGGAGAIAAVGLGIFAHHAAQVLDLKRGFILSGGKAALQPFNQLLWVLWALFTLPMIAVGLVNVVAGGGAFDQYAWAGLAIAFALLSIAFPQLEMNRMLSREKAQELQALRAELADAANVPKDGPTRQAVQALLRHQHLLHQLEEAKGFAPTLVDTRFAIQIGISFTAIIAANIALRTVLARFVP